SPRPRTRKSILMILDNEEEAGEIAIALRSEGVTSASAAMDVALSELNRRARLRHDVEAYTRKARSR
ncbi:MAG: hypothetical protein M3N98_16485, partial [Actinomycetota bacterium]|nr:hypothetical protein [Actinomycetota bacterium]